MPPLSPRKRTRNVLTHLDAQGRARMVDVGHKDVTEREAVARAEIRMLPATMKRIHSGQIAKGEVLAVARLAGIMAAKHTADIIPLCHPLALNSVEVNFVVLGEGELQIEARVRVSGKTGVEMEALTAASVAALTVYDMCKAIDRGMIIGNVRLMAKRGGRSGAYRRKE